MWKSEVCLKKFISKRCRLKKRRFFFKNPLNCGAAHCRELGSLSVAEGVENSSQMDILKKLGCDWIQGYLLSKPVPVEDFEEKYNKQ